MLPNNDIIASVYLYFMKLGAFWDEHKADSPAGHTDSIRKEKFDFNKGFLTDSLGGHHWSNKSDKIVQNEPPTAQIPPPLLRQRSDVVRAPLSVATLPKI